MGWRGTLRSIAAAQRAAERAAVRRHRDYVRQAKQEAKLEALRQAAFEVEQFENTIECITSVHRDCSAAWNWRRFRDAPEPARPSPSSDNERRALHKRDSFRPSFLDKLLRRVERRIGALESGVRKAREDDAAAHERALQEFAKQHEEWAEMRELATRIIALDERAFHDALQELSPLSELTDLGSSVSFGFPARGVVAVSLSVNSDSVIPSETKSLLQSGKLSTKKMPAARFYELYQDYVAGATFRIAREVFALLPVNTVQITAVANMLDSSTGYMRDQPILSVVMPRSTVEGLRFDTLDPSDALRHFNHRMDFKKTKGFAPVSQVTA